MTYRVVISGQAEADLRPRASADRADLSLHGAPASERPPAPAKAGAPGRLSHPQLPECSHLTELTYRASGGTYLVPSCQKATALAAATLRESTPQDMGIVTM